MGKFGALWILCCFWPAEAGPFLLIVSTFVVI